MKLLDYGLRDLTVAAGRSLGVTACSLVAPLLVLLTLGWRPDNSLLALGLGSSGALAGWLAGLDLFAHPVKSEIGLAVSRVLPALVRAS